MHLPDVHDNIGHDAVYITVLEHKADGESFFNRPTLIFSLFPKRDLHSFMHRPPFQEKLQHLLSLNRANVSNL